MSKRQTDMFAALEPPPPAPPPPDPALVESQRRWMDERLAFLKAASSWPWPPNSLDPWHIQSEFKAAVKLLPPEEGAPLLAEFEVEIERVFDQEAIEHEKKFGHLPLPDNAREVAELMLRDRPNKPLPPWGRDIPEYAHLAVKMPADWVPPATLPPAEEAA